MTKRHLLPPLAVGSSAIISLLMRSGANINRILPRTVGDTSGCTAMDLAWEGRHVDAMNVVRQYGGYLRSEMPSMPVEGIPGTPSAGQAAAAGQPQAAQAAPTAQGGYAGAYAGYGAAAGQPQQGQQAPVQQVRVSSD